VSPRWGRTHRKLSVETIVSGKKVLHCTALHTPTVVHHTVFSLREAHHHCHHLSTSQFLKGRGSRATTRQRAAAAGVVGRETSHPPPPLTPEDSWEGEGSEDDLAGVVAADAAAAAAMGDVEAALKTLAGEVKMAIVQNESFLRDSLGAAEFLSHADAAADLATSVAQRRRATVRPVTMLTRVASAQGED
jgi:hypothetical protein